MADRCCLVVALVLTSAPVASAQPPKPAPGAGLPDGAVARLGQTRLRHAERPTCVAFAPDGKTFVTGGEDGTVRVWSVATGDLVRMLQKPRLGVTALRYTHGGTRLAVHYASETVVRLLEPGTLREEGSIPFVNRYRFALSADAKLFAANDTLGNLVVTETEPDLPKLELAQAEVFDFRPDGKAIAVGGAEGNVAVHLITGGKRIFKLANLGPVTGLAFRPDGKRLAVGTRAPDGTERIRVYTDAGEQSVAEVPGMNLPLAWLSDTTLAVGNGTDAGVYDLDKKRFAARIAGAPGAVAVSPDGTKLVATGGGSGLRVRVWDLTTGKQLLAENDSFPDPALMVGTADGKSLFLIAADNAYLWSLGAPAVKSVGSLPGRAVAAALNGGTLAVATPDAVCVYLDFDPLKPLATKPAVTFEKSAKAKVVAVTPDGKRIAWTDESGTVVVTDLTGRKRTQLPVVTTSVLALQFSPDGSGLAQFGRDGFLRLWATSAPTGEFSEQWKTRLGRGLKATIAFSPDGRLIAAASLAQVPVFHVADGSEVFKADRYSDEGYAQHAAFSPDSRLLVFGSSGTAGRVEVWELATRDLVVQFSSGYGGISRLCVFPDGNRIASAGAEEAVTIWELVPRGMKGPPKPNDLLAAWAALESPKAAVGYPAIKFLGAAGDSAADTISSGTKELIATQKKAAEWAEDLGSKSFAVRESAAKELLALGPRALPALGTATTSGDTDVRDRARELLLKLQENGATVPGHGLVGDALRLVRAVQALEQIGTARAQEALTEIAGTGGRAGEEAKAALARLKKKP